MCVYEDFPYNTAATLHQHPATSPKLPTTDPTFYCCSVQGTLPSWFGVKPIRNLGSSKVTDLPLEFTSWLSKLANSIATWGNRETIFTQGHKKYWPNPKFKENQRGLIEAVRPVSAQVNVSHNAGSHTLFRQNSISDHAHLQPLWTLWWHYGIWDSHILTTSPACIVHLHWSCTSPIAMCSSRI